MSFQLYQVTVTASNKVDTVTLRVRAVSSYGARLKALTQAEELFPGVVFCSDVDVYPLGR